MQKAELRRRQMTHKLKFNAMWSFLVRLILRNRLVNLIVIVVLTGIMGFYASKVQMSYEFAEMLPATDSTRIVYKQFKEQFGEDGSVMFIGVRDSSFFDLEHFNAWFDLTQEIKKIEGVQEVLSVTKVFQLIKDDSLKKFDFRPVVPEKPETQDELDSLRALIYSLPFYDGLLFNKETNVNLLMITLDKAKVNSNYRFQLIGGIQEKIEAHASKFNIEPHYSGLPYIRTVTSEKVKNELLLFTLLSLLIAAIILFLYFRSFKAVIFPLFIVSAGAVWVLGTVSLLGYKISILTGILPPLIIIIGIENCIFLLNKYHFEFKSHGNKVKALSRIVQRVGFATLLTNLTTAVGFATFLITGNRLLFEFGLVASVNIVVLYVLSLFLIPIFFSYLKPPAERHTRHIENKTVGRIVAFIVNVVQKRRPVIYITAVLFVAAGVFGVSRLTTTGNIVDDISKKDKLYTDLLFFEEHFHGVMPFEISIDTKKKKGVMNLGVLKKIDRLQDSLAVYPELSRPLSVAEVVKFAKQAFYNGDESMYDLPNNNEMVFMVDYIPEYNKKKKTILNNFVDSTLSKTRISVQMANIGTRDIQRIKDDLRPKIDSIFNPDKFDVHITGTSVVFLKGTDYLVGNLKTSLIFAVIIISILMALLFTSARMVLISLITNLIPQVMTAGMMGYLGIPIKPSTILIFSIALGISVDNAILFLSRYRQELRNKHWDIRQCVLSALRETSYSMVYSSSVLFLGFSIFIFSSFGGTQAMGYLISFTLFIAMLCNLLLLPSLLLSFGKRATTKAFKEPVLPILEEEEEDVTIEYMDEIIEDPKKDLAAGGDKGDRAG
jgi:uncharacterized protein